METAWLIEMPLKSVGGPPVWWTGRYTGHMTDPWTLDSLQAVRFCRKQDAEAVMAGTIRLKEAVATEHIWG